MILYDKIDIRTLDFEFKGRNFKKDLIKSVHNYINKYKSIKHIDTPIEDLIHTTTGFNFILPDKDCGGFCDFDNKVIAIDLNAKSETIIPTIIHESVHSLQAEIGLFDFTENTLSDMIKLEQQCETVSYLINLKLFNKNTPELFNTYFSKADAYWLAEWYGDDIQNDLF